MELIPDVNRYVCPDREGTHRSPRLGHGLGAHEVFVRGPPYATRRATRAPALRALPTAAPRIRGVGSEQSTPPGGQPGQLTTRHRQQRPVVGVARQLVKHVKPIPHPLPQDLTQNPLHLATFPPSPPCIGVVPPHGPITHPRPPEWGNDPPEGPALRRSAGAGGRRGLRRQLLGRVGRRRGLVGPREVGTGAAAGEKSGRDSSAAPRRCQSSRDRRRSASRHTARSIAVQRRRRQRQYLGRPKSADAAGSCPGQQLFQPVPLLPAPGYVFVRAHLSMMTQSLPRPLWEGPG